MGHPKRADREIQDNTADLGLLDDGTVVIQFGSLVKQMTFTPAQARALGVGFIEMATRGASVQQTQASAGRTRSASKVSLVGKTH